MILNFLNFHGANHSEESDDTFDRGCSFYAVRIDFCSDKQRYVWNDHFVGTSKWTKPRNQTITAWSVVAETHEENAS